MIYTVNYKLQIENINKLFVKSYMQFIGLLNLLNYKFVTKKNKMIDK